MTEISKAEWERYDRYVDGLSAVDAKRALRAEARMRADAERAIRKLGGDRWWRVTVLEPDEREPRSSYESAAANG